MLVLKKIVLGFLLGILVGVGTAVGIAFIAAVLGMYTAGHGMEALSVRTALSYMNLSGADIALVLISASACVITWGICLVGMRGEEAA